MRKAAKVSLFLTVSEVGELEKSLTNKIEDTVAGDAKALEQILEDHCLKFHPQHYLILIIKWLLINIYGRQPGMVFVTEFSHGTLENRSFFLIALYRVF